MFLKQLTIFTILTLFFLTNLNAKVEFSDAIKQKKIYPMGAKIYTKMCSKDIYFEKYSNQDELKEAIKNEGLCKPLREKHLQALSIYLWDVKRVVKDESSLESIKVTNDEKCPVCGMFVYKYPKWATQIFYEDKHYSFDGAKDMLKYYLEYNEKIVKILVRDYYSQKTIDAQKAYYVIGSDVYGPMGDELIPFENESDAKTFNMDHRGHKIIYFKDITKEELHKLDE